MIRLIITFLLLTHFLSLLANTRILSGREAHKLIPNTELVRLKEFTEVPNYVKFKKGHEMPLSNLELWLNRLYGKNISIELKLIGEEKDLLGKVHYRYQQIHNGFPMEMTMLIVHTYNGLIESINGELFSKVDGVLSPSMNESTALDVALDYANGKIFKWEIPSQEAHLRWEQEDSLATYYPKGELVLVNENGDLNKELSLAYKFDIYVHEPIARKNIYVDARTGNVLWYKDLIHDIDSVGIATTIHSAVQTITSDHQGGGSFRLREVGRGNGIRTFTCGNTTNYTNTDITNTSADWVMTEAGLDAHWGSEVTYDYFLNEHGRNSIDNAGFILNSYVHFGQNFSNAFWDGFRMTYGDGQGNNTTYAALDIAAHEITHGLNSATADLASFGESGALNESFSDIFGISVDYINRPGVADWRLGDDLGIVIRNMQNPNLLGDPDTYLGNNWAPTSIGSPDNGGVHINCGVQNFWFFLLTDGGSGVNDNGDAYSVNGIGLSDAGKVAYRNLTVYLTPSSQYEDASFFAIQSAIDLFGSCSPEVESVTDAWYAVGIGNAYVPFTISDFEANVSQSCEIPFTVDFINHSTNGSSYSWDFGDGGSSSQYEPTHTYNAYGTYTVELIADGGALCGNPDTNTKVAFIHVDSLSSCSVILPINGTHVTQTSCSGSIFDSGGEFAAHGANEDAQVTILSSVASSIDLSFVSFDLEPGPAGSCNFDYLEVYDGPSTSSPLINRYCNNNMPPTSLSSSFGAVTIVFHSDPLIEGTGFQIDWQCNIPTSPPVVSFEADVDTTCNGNIQFTDLSTNGATSWFWDFGDGAGTSIDRNPSYTYASNGVYTVKLVATNVAGSDSSVQSNLIYVDRPPEPTVTGDVVCENTTANLTATGSGTLNWYSDSLGGVSINSGSSYLTPSLDSTTSYFVEDLIVAPTQSVGKTDDSGGGGFYNLPDYLIFDIYEPTEIIDVQVYPGSNGIRTIELRNNIGIVLQSKLVALNGVGPQTITLNFNVSPGVDYQLGISNNTTMDLFRNVGGINYPYDIAGLISIKRSSSPFNNGLDRYYFFYNWNVKASDCLSPRAKVTAVVNSCTGLGEVIMKPALSAFLNGANLELRFTDFQRGTYNLIISNTLGQVVTRNEVEVLSKHQVEQLDWSNKPKGVYLLNVFNENNSYTLKYTK